MFKEFDKLNKKELLKIVAVVTLSDGTLYNKNKKYIRLVTKENDCQHNFFRYLCVKISDKEPNKCKIKSINGFSREIDERIQSTLNSKEVVVELLKLSPTYKTTRGPISKEDYLQSPQPTAKFLFDESKGLRWLALRTWFDFDGCIIPSFRLKYKKDKKNGKVYCYYQVQFEYNQYF